MKNFTSKIAMMLTVVGITSVVSTATANNDYRRINREARKIERKANLLAQEIVHYSEMPQYCHLADDLNEFVRLSQHITDLVRVSSDLRHIKADVNALDRNFHHIEGIFDRMERQIARGRGVKFGNTAHVKRLLNAIEDCIHVMQEDVAVLEVRSHRHLNQRPIYDDHRFDRNRGFQYQEYRYTPRPSYGGGCPNANRGGGGFGFSIGGGSSRIHIRF